MGDGDGLTRRRRLGPRALEVRTSTDDDSAAVVQVSAEWSDRAAGAARRGTDGGEER